MHEAQILRTQIERLTAHLQDLSDRARGEAFQAYPLVHESVAELQTALEELRVSEEEMSVAGEELAEAQLQVAGERQRYWRLFQFAPVAYLVTDLNGIIRDANLQAGQLLGMDADRLRGRPLASRVRQQDRAAFRTCLTRVGAGEEPEMDLAVLRAEGAEVPVAVHVSHMPGNAGQEAGVLCMMRDLSERMAAEEQARHLAAERVARAEAERANRVKSDFLAVMSHELRTPLTSIMAYTELLQMGIPVAMPDAAQPHLACVEEASRHLLLLIEEILGFARLEAGREEVKPVPMDLRELMGDVRTFVEPLAQKRGLELRFAAPDQPVEVVTDRAKVRQILINLVSNAVKFTPHGRVAVELSPLPTGHAEFHVSDTGPGIDPANLDRVFEPFWQGQQGTTRAAGGTGLGLSIARKMAEVLGGTLTAHSTVGEGSTFTLHLPPVAPAIE
jgi:PAS domain S-box-containing protein